MGKMSPGAILWRNRDFNIFWTGQTLSALGDAFAFIALPLLVLQATGSVQQMGLVTGTFGVGQLVAGIFSGAVVDKVDRRKLMILCDIGRALLYGAIPLVWLLSGPQLWLIYVVTGFGALLGNTFGVAYITAIANLVERDQITEANGRLQVTFATAFLVGPMLAGFVSQHFGPVTALGINAFSFLASAVSILFIRLRRVETGVVVAQMGKRMTWVGELLAGARFLMQEPTLRAIALLIGAFTLLATSAGDLFIFHLKHDLGQDDNAVGVLFGVASIGAIAAGALAPMLRRRWGFAVCWLAAGFVQAVPLLIMGVANTLEVIAASSMVFFFAQTVRGINSMSLRQEITPDHLLGRVTAAFWTLNTAPGPIGAALMTALAARAGVPFTFVVMGVGALLLAVIALFTPIRRQTSHALGEMVPASAGDLPEASR